MRGISSGLCVAAALNTLFGRLWAALWASCSLPAGRQETRRSALRPPCGRPARSPLFTLRCVNNGSVPSPAFALSCAKNVFCHSKVRLSDEQCADGQGVPPSEVLGATLFATARGRDCCVQRVSDTKLIPRILVSRHRLWVHTPRGAHSRFLTLTSEKSTLH